MKPVRPLKPVTPRYLENAALAYLKRFATTTKQLEVVLARKARRRAGEVTPAATAAIRECVERCVRAGLVDDAVYARMKATALRRRGGSGRAIAFKLKAKGLGQEHIAPALAEAPDELTAAVALARRKRLGPFRKGTLDPKSRQKELGALVRAGFAYGLARKVVDAASPDALG